jgi:transposase
MREGAGVFKIDLPKVVANDENDLTVRMRRLLSELFQDLLTAESRVADLTREIEALSHADDRARRLQTIPGLGPMGATALLAAVGDARQFRRARDLAVWLGLVPRQHSTGGKTVLLGISKRGNAYLRRLLIHGARSCVLHLDRSRDQLGRWIDGLQKRMHVNKVTVALANKIARIAWVILTRPGALYRRIDPAFA